MTLNPLISYKESTVGAFDPDSRCMQEFAFHHHQNMQVLWPRNAGG